jgi:RNA polymerase sigma-70 factor (ECF subfamily)
MSHDSSPQPVNPELIARAIDRDERACSQMVETLYPLVIGIVRRNLPRHQAAEDLAQEIFVKLFTSLEKFRGESPFEHWVSRIATLSCYESLRRQKSRPILEFSELDMDHSQDASDSFDPNAVDVQPAQSSLELLQKLLATLKPRDQMVIRLLHLEEKSVAEIASETGWSHSKIKVTAMRAREKMKKALRNLESQSPQSIRHESKSAANRATRPGSGRVVGDSPVSS